MKRIVSFVMALLLLSYGWAYYQKAGEELPNPDEYTAFISEKKDAVLEWYEEAKNVLKTIKN